MDYKVYLQQLLKCYKATINAIRFSLVSFYICKPWTFLQMGNLYVQPHLFFALLQHNTTSRTQIGSCREAVWLYRTAPMAILYIINTHKCFEEDMRKIKRFRKLRIKLFPSSVFCRWSFLGQLTIQFAWKWMWPHSYVCCKLPQSIE